jgi:ABC-type glycerol-3-phosphate transport system permease component
MINGSAVDWLQVVFLKQKSCFVILINIQCTNPNYFPSQTIPSQISTFINLGFGRLSLSILILRSFFVTLPRSLEDAARVDGLSPLKIYWKIMLPLALPALYTVIILQTIFVWNEFLFALVFIRSLDMFTLPRGLWPLGELMSLCMGH